MSDETQPQTIGDVIAAQVDAATSQAAASTAAEAADAALADANAALSAANSELAADLTATGPVFTVDTDGLVVVYFPDASSTGYHTIAPVPANTPLPSASAPTP